MNDNLRIVGSFNNPSDVTSQMETLKPDVVIMDIDMPVMTGIEAVAKARTVNRDTPIIMLTVFDDNQHVFDAICAGATARNAAPATPARTAGAARSVSRPCPRPPCRGPSCTRPPPPPGLS